MSETTTVRVTILDKNYEVACGAEEVDAVKASAEHVDRQMQAIRNSGKVIGLDRMAVMAALNIANEYLETEARRRQTEERIDMLAEKLRHVLKDQSSVETV